MGVRFKITVSPPVQQEEMCASSYILTQLCYFSGFCKCEVFNESGNKVVMSINSRDELSNKSTTLRIKQIKYSCDAT